MAAPPNAPYATHQIDVRNGSSQQKAQASYSATGHCPRCVRICINCQRGPPPANGYQVPVPNLARGTVQLQHHTYQGSCLPAAYKNSGNTQKAFQGPACIPVDNCSDQSSLSSDQEAMERTTSDESPTVPIDVQRSEYANADTSFSRPPLHGMSMQEKITEEATLDETTEKTSFMPSQRDSGPSTWQDASRMGPQKEDPSKEEALLNEGLPPHECSEKEFKSSAMQANLFQEELYEPLSSLTDRLGDPSEGMESESSDEACRESLSYRDTFVNECTPPERRRLDLGELPSYDHPRKHQADQTCRVMDCLQRCSEKLEEIQHSSDCNPPTNDLGECLPQQQQSPPVESDEVCETTVPEAALSINFTRVELEDTHIPSQGSFEKNLHECTRQCNLQVDIESRGSPELATVDNMPCDMLEELQIPGKSSLSKSSLSKTGSVALKQTYECSGSQSEITAKVPPFFKEKTSTIESSSCQQSGHKGSTAQLGDTEKRSPTYKEQTTKTESTTKAELPSAQQSGIIGQDGSAPQSEESPSTTQQACNIQASSKHQTRQEDSTKKFSSSKEQTSQMESFSKEQSGTSEQFPSDSSGNKSLSKDAVSTTVLHHPALGIVRHPSDSTVIKCTLTRENLSLCKQLCDKLNEIPPEERPPRRTQSRQSETIRSSQSTSTSRQQLLQTRKELESQRMAESKRKITRYDSPSKKPASQQDAILKKLSRQDSSTKKSVSRQEFISKKPVAKKSVSQQESFSKKSASVHPMELSDRSESRTQLSDKPSVSMSVNSKVQASQSAKYFVPIRTENKQAKTHTPRHNWEESPMQSSDRKQGSESMYPQSERSRSMAFSSLPADQISSITNTSTGLAPQQMTRKPDKEKTPPQSQQTSDSENTRSRSKSVSLQNKDELNKGRTAQTERAKTPPKSDKPKSSGKNLDKNGIRNDEDPSQLVAKSYISEERSASAAPVPKESDTPAYCLQAYYLPLYQCAYCQQITPYPVTCQFGFASCPSPCDPCLHQPCQLSSPCVLYPYPMYAPPCPPPNPQDNQFEPIAPCSQTQTEQKVFPQPRNIEYHPSRATCPTDDETIPCSAPCQPCDFQCGAPSQLCDVPCKNSQANAGYSDDEKGKYPRRSFESDQSDLRSEVKSTKSETMNDSLGGKYKNRSTAISDTSESGSIKRNKKVQRLRREIKESAKKMDDGVGRATNGRRKLRKEHGRSEKPRRETVIRKGTDRRDSVNASSHIKRKFRCIQSEDTSEEPAIESQRSPRRSNSAHSGYQHSTITRLRTSNQGMAQLLHITGEGRKDIKITPTIDIEDHRKSSRSIRQNIFFRPAGLHGMVRTAHHTASPPLQSYVLKNALRKQFAPSHREPNRIGKIALDSHCLLPGERSIGTKWGAQQWTSSTCDDPCCQTNNAHCEQRTCSVAKSNGGSQKSTTETKGGQMKTKANSHISSVDAVYLLSDSSQYGYLDRKNLRCPYYIPSTGAPQRAHLREVTKRLELSNCDMQRSSKSSEHKLPTQQSDDRNLSPPSSPSSWASSHVQDLVSRHPDCGSQILSHFSCAEWMKDANLPEHLNCCAHAWVNAPHHGCSLHPHLRCTRDSCRMSSRRRHTKAKPLSLHSQRTRLAMMRGKRVVATHTKLK